MSRDEVDAGGVTQSFGGFSLGTLQLALPMSALREVVGASGLVDLPCPAAFVIGGIALRGVVVPVVDLRIVLGRPAPAGSARNVVVMLHGERIVGLLADTVTGIFEAAADSFHPVEVNDPVAAIFLAGVQRADNHEMATVLSAEALSRLPQLPMVEDPEPARRCVEAVCGDGPPADLSVPMMLLQCNGVPLAVEAMLVHATLADPDVTPSALTRGHCRGVIDYNGAQVPAVDLLALCGLGRLDTDAAMQAFIVSAPTGFVAFLVSGVVDVVRTSAGDVVPVPAFALSRAELFAGALSTPTRSTTAADRTGIASTHYLVISTDGLTGCEEVRSLSSLNVRADAAGAAASVLSPTGTPPLRTALITYLLDTEQATPIDQVTEILPYVPGIELPHSDGPLLGFLLDRGRSIPVVCLSQVTGRPASTPTASTSVLIVESVGELIGFAVRSLKSIEQADWHPSLPDFQPGVASDGVFRATEPRRLSLVGAGDTERMLPTIDLLACARALQHGAVRRVAA